MATPPTLVNSGFSSFTTATTPKTSAAFDVVSGDLILVVGIDTWQTGMSTPTATGGSITWTAVQTLNVTNFDGVVIWSGAVGATATGITISVAETLGDVYGMAWTLWRNHNGVGTSGQANSATGTPSLALSTGDNSAIFCGNGDFNALANTTVTYRNVNSTAPTQMTKFRTSTTHAGEVFYYADSGATGTSTVGMTAPAGQQWSLVAVEVLAITATNYTPSAADTGAGSDTADTQMDVVEQADDTGAGSDTTALDRTTTTADTGAGSDARSVAQGMVRAASDTGSGNDATAQVLNGLRAAGDVGSGSDATGQTINAVRAVSDTGSGSDAAVASFILIQTPADTGAGADNITALQNMAPTVADTGSGSDSAQIQRSVNAGPQDAGSGADAATLVQSQNLGLTDTGAGSDSILAGLVISQTYGDTGAGTDATSQATDYVRSAPDTGAGSDTLAQRADNVRSAADSGGGVDAINRAAAINRTAADAGAGHDAITTALGLSITVGDVGTGTDAIVIPGMVHDLVLSSVPLATRWTVAELMSRWSVTATGQRWATTEWLRWSVTPLPARWAVTAGDPAMSVDVLISAGAAKYVGGTITDVNGVDISSGTFQISLGSDKDPGPWQTPDVSVAGATAASRIVKMLVSSSNPAGLERGTYWAWVRVSTAPEIEPLRVQGPINVR